MTHNTNWFYKEKEILSLEDLGSNVYGFVYKITDKKTGLLYIGKKILFSNRKKKLTLAEKANLPQKPGKKPSFKRVIQETNWKDYYGSSERLLKEINTRGKLDFSREIIRLCYTKKQLTYWEMHYQCTHQVLLYDSYNDSILSKFYRKDLLEN